MYIIENFVNNVRRKVEIIHYIINNISWKYCIVYSKQCYTRNFGTIDLRQANLPHRDDRINTSPIRPTLTGSTARSHGTTSPTQEEIAVEGQFDRAKREQSPRKASGSPAFQTKVCS